MTELQALQEIGGALRVIAFVLIAKVVLDYFRWVIS